MSKVIRLITVLAVMVGLLAVPSVPASATLDDTAGTVEFTGTAVVGAATSLGLKTFPLPLAGDGLCRPPLRETTPTCSDPATVPGPVTPSNGFVLSVNKPALDTASDDRCQATGTIAGLPAPATLNNCSIIASGMVLQDEVGAAGMPPYGPACGNSEGITWLLEDGSGALDYDDAINIPIDGVDMKWPIWAKWITSAGTILPIKGQLDAGSMLPGPVPLAHPHDFEGFISAIPKATDPDPTKRACIDYPATKFTVSGELEILTTAKFDKSDLP